MASDPSRRNGHDPRPGRKQREGLDRRHQEDVHQGGIEGADTADFGGRPLQGGQGGRFNLDVGYASSFLPAFVRLNFELHSSVLIKDCMHG